MKKCVSCGAENHDAAAVCGECGKAFGGTSWKNNLMNRKIPPLWIGVGAAVVLIPVIMWGYGFIDAMSDVHDGLNLFGYKKKTSEMNLISRHGYRTYVRSFTDLEERQRQFNSSLEQLMR